MIASRPARFAAVAVGLALVWSAVPAIAEVTDREAWGSGSGAVDHQVAQLERDGRRIGVAVLTEGNPSHAYGKKTLKGVFRRLLRGLPR